MESQKTPRWHTTLSVLTTLPKLLKLVWQASWGCTLALGVLTLIQGVLPVTKLWVGKLIMDSVITAIGANSPSEHIQRVLLLTALELALVVIANLLSRTQSFTQTMLAERFRIHTTTRILEQSVALDLAYYETPAFYNQLQRAQQDAGNRPILVLQALFRLVQSALQGSTILLLVLRLHWLIAVGLMLVTLPSFLIDVKFSERQYFLRMYQTADGRRASYLVSLLTSPASIKEVKLFGLGAHLIQQWNGVYQQFYRDNKALALRNNGANLLVGLFSTLGFYASYAYLLVQAIFRHITVGDLTMYAGAFGSLQGSVHSILREVASIYEAHLYVSNFFDFLALQPRIANVPNPLPFPQPLKQGITFEQVGFRYTEDGPMVLHDIELHIQPGESVAIVGENGAGKTTLIKLLTRLYDPTAGRILLDGIDLREFELRELARSTGAIFQDFARYYVPVRENIGFGQLERMGDLEGIVRAAEKSGADTFIGRLPQQYDTMLGRLFEGGVELSLGEWQKLALARAFLRDAPILILDEPTASLDAKTEYEVFQRFRKLTEEKVAILISHRFSTVRMADRIVVLERGGIIEEGSHEELMVLGGTYARMFRMQAESYQ